MTTWCVYVLLLNDGSLYTGCSNNFEKRLKTHQEGKGSKYVRSRLPVKDVVRLEYGYKNRSEALKREFQVRREIQEERRKNVKKRNQ